ncbi:MAG: hypothetical protein LBQ51_00880 [Desulfovibrio sp.]|nr:hypothetical protein [Desulfovibrio sp.]
MSGTISGPATGVNTNIVESANLSLAAPAANAHPMVRSTGRSAGAGANLSPAALSANAANGLNAVSGDKPLSDVSFHTGKRPDGSKVTYAVQLVERISDKAKIVRIYSRSASDQQSGDARKTYKSWTSTPALLDRYQKVAESFWARKGISDYPLYK